MATIVISRQIENKIIELLQVEDYIINNNIPVESWRNLDDIKGMQAVIHAQPEAPYIRDAQGRVKQFLVKVDLLAYIHNAQSDIPANEIISLYEFLYSWCLNLQKSNLIFTDLQVDGLNENQSDEAFDERFHEEHASLNIYVSIK